MQSCDVHAHMQAIGEVEVVTDSVTSAAARVVTQPSQQLLPNMQQLLPEALVMAVPQARLV